MNFCTKSPSRSKTLAGERNSLRSRPRASPAMDDAWLTEGSPAAKPTSLPTSPMTSAPLVENARLMNLGEIKTRAVAVRGEARGEGRGCVSRRLAARVEAPEAAARVLRRRRVEDPRARVVPGDEGRRRRREEERDARDQDRRARRRGAAAARRSTGRGGVVGAEEAPRRRRRDDDDAAGAAVAGVQSPRVRPRRRRGGEDRAGGAGRVRRRGFARGGGGHQIPRLRRRGAGTDARRSAWTRSPPRRTTTSWAATIAKTSGWCPR